MHGISAASHWVYMMNLSTGWVMVFLTVEHTMIEDQGKVLPQLSTEIPEHFIKWRPWTELSPRFQQGGISMDWKSSLWTCRLHFLVPFPLTGPSCCTTPGAPSTKNILWMASTVIVLCNSTGQPYSWLTNISGLIGGKKKWSYHSGDGSSLLLSALPYPLSYPHPLMSNISSSR
jgi:hypothetical protein